MKVIAHVDMDAFYTQVEIGRDPEHLAGQPVVVIQYNPFGDLSTVRPEDDRIKPDSNGSIIAVSYEARKFGVKRNMMAQQAKKVCPNLQIVQVPVAHGKADLTIYRDAGAAVITVLSKSAVCERASIDEAYLDVTAAAQQLLANARKRSAGGGSSGASRDGAPMPATAAAAAAADADELAAALVAAAEAGGADEQQGDGLHEAELVLPLPASFEGWHIAGVDPEGAEAVRDWWCRPAAAWDPSDALLAAGALVVARARAAVKASLGFSCSAGIAHSKILAKLGSGLHKPAQQTVVPGAAVAGLLAPLPISKLRQLGGKFGEEVMAKFGVTTVGELAAVPLPRLEAVLGPQDATWLHRLAQGKDGEEVKPRTLPKSISCGKTFRGHNVLTGLTAVHTWLLQLGNELQERIEADRQQHQRLPKLLTVSFDSAPVAAAEGGAAPEGAAAAAAAAGEEGAGAGAAGADAGGGGSAGAGGGGLSHGRLTVQNWRAGASNISRSCVLRHPRADAIAADALGLVKKWARDRPNGFRIVTMFISASNFSIAPTGASTLDRFLTAPAAAAAAGADPAAAAATAHKHTPQQPPAHPQQQQQQQVGLPTAPSAAASELPSADPGLSSAGRVAGTKRPAAATAAGRAGAGRLGKAARTDKQQGNLRSFLAAAPVAPAPAAAEKLLSASAVDAAPAAAVVSTSVGAAGLDGAAGCWAGASSFGENAEDAEGSQQDSLAAAGQGSQDVHVVSASCDDSFGSDADGPGVDSALADAVTNSTAGGGRIEDSSAGASMAAAASSAQAGSAAPVDRVPAAAFAAPMAVAGLKTGSPAARSALSALQRLPPAAPYRPDSPTPAFSSLVSPAGRQPGGPGGEGLGVSCSSLVPPQPPQEGSAAAGRSQGVLPSMQGQQQQQGFSWPAECPAGVQLGQLVEQVPQQQQQQGVLVLQGERQQQGLQPTGPITGLQDLLPAAACAEGSDAAVAAAPQAPSAGQPQADMLAAEAALQERQQDGSCLHLQEQMQKQGSSGAAQDEQQQQQVQQDVQQAPAQGYAAAQPLQLSDVDPDVLAALPWDLQLEVQQQLRAGGRGGARIGGGGRRGRAGGRGGGRKPPQAQERGSIDRYLQK